MGAGHAGGSAAVALAPGWRQSLGARTTLSESSGSPRPAAALSSRAPAHPWASADFVKQSKRRLPRPTSALRPGPRPLLRGRQQLPPDVVHHRRVWRLLVVEIVPAPEGARGSACAQRGARRSGAPHTLACILRRRRETVGLSRGVTEALRGGLHSSVTRGAATPAFPRPRPAHGRAGGVRPRLRESAGGRAGRRKGRQGGPPPPFPLVLTGQASSLPSYLLDKPRPSPVLTGHVAGGGGGGT